MEDLIKCCFCGNSISENDSNNPWPVCSIEEARCCLKCNWRVVIPARMVGIKDPDQYEMPKFEVYKNE